MKKETIKKRLEKQAINKSAASYRLLTEWLNAEGNNVIRPCWPSGRGRFTTNLDYTQQLANLLTMLKVQYIAGNDAARGGKCGNFIKIIL